MIILSLLPILEHWLRCRIRQSGSVSFARKYLLMPCFAWSSTRSEALYVNEYHLFPAFQLVSPLRYDIVWQHICHNLIVFPEIEIVDLGLLDPQPLCRLFSSWSLRVFRYLWCRSMACLPATPTNRTGCWHWSTIFLRNGYCETRLR